MTDATNGEALLPCPFCGHVTEDLRDGLHPSGTRWREDNGFRHYISRKDPREHHGRCWEMNCLKHEGGCGANITADSREEVIEAWNRRQPTASSGMVFVPREPTEAMLDAGRTAVMARDCSGPKWGPADHFEATGFDTTGIPSRLLEGRYKMSKEWGAELVYAAMLAAHESQQKPRVNVGTIGHVSRDKSTLAAALTKVVSPPADTTPDVSEPTDNVEGE